MANCSFSSITSTPNGNINYYVACGVDNNFKNNIQETMQKLSIFSPKTQKALSKLKNVIVLKDSQSIFPEGFLKTKKKLDEHASDAYGFVCKPDSAVVINEGNHQRKDISLEGSVASQASDTLSHEIGHLFDEEYSTSEEFKQAYIQDLKDIEKKLNKKEKVNSRSLTDMLSYLKHYMEGANFSDGIDENDITREGLRENFAECFSTIVDSKPSEINYIFSSLFPRAMEQTYKFMI